MIQIDQPMKCRWADCGFEMMPIDILTMEDRWIPTLIVVIMQCPVCKTTRRWQCRVDDMATIHIGEKRAYADQSDIGKGWNS